MTEVSDKGNELPLTHKSDEPVSIWRGYTVDYDQQTHITMHRTGTRIVDCEAVVRNA